MWTAVLFAVIAVVALVAVLAGASIRILREYERAVVFRLGRLLGVKGPGLVLLIPAIDRMVRVDLRTVTLDIPPQDLITRDNVPGDRLRRALPRGHIADRADDAALGARQGRPRHAAVRTGAAQ